MRVVLAIDCMGGDHGLSVTIPAILMYREDHPNVGFMLVGRAEEIRAQLSRRGVSESDNLVVHDASEVVEMDDSPVMAVRNKRQSSMRLAIDLVKSGGAHACVSAGNTGALMATARFVLKTLPGIDRPAICTAMPTLKGWSYVLDLGANVDCEAHHLFQFGLMASELVAAVEHRETPPTVGLLNIGEEDIKGNDVVKQAATLFRASDLNFFGNVEGNDIFRGVVDIVVCDGFVGNVVLKSSEGLAQMVAYHLRQEFSRTWWSRFAAMCSWPVIKRVKAVLDHRRYNGANLLGLRGVVIKSHGSADAFAFQCAIGHAVETVLSDVVARIDHRLQARLVAAELESPIVEPCVI